jgi:lysophospholipase L1-like esterase
MLPRRLDSVSDASASSLAGGAAASPVPGWRRFAALGDSLTAGRGDPGPDGRRIGWAHRLAALLSERTAVRCDLTNLAADGAGVAVVLSQQLPRATALQPDLVSVTVGMNDVRLPEFDPAAFAADLDRLLAGLAGTGATVLTCTLPDWPAVAELPAEYAEYVGIASRRLRQASDIIRETAARHRALCLDMWAMPELIADPALFTADRLHPNSSGHRSLAAAFAGLLLAT